MSVKKFEQLARDEATLSTCAVRKVGAILVNPKGNVIGRGYNSSATCNCTAPEGICTSDVVHAEVVCLASVSDSAIAAGSTLYITHPPCNDCIETINEFNDIRGIKLTIHVCEGFIKFDDDKLRFDLIPPLWEEELAKVLSHGAKKYKPNNWQQGEIDRYVAAAMRHFNAYRSGEQTDADSGLSHLSHLMTNIGFLITLENDI